MNSKVDVCVIGSGAGGAPVATTIANAGYNVVILEKGPWFKTTDFYKDELAAAHRDIYTPKNEPQVVEHRDIAGNWYKNDQANLWNGNCVGGATNFMSGSFYRLKPNDFNLRSQFGSIDGANVVDWPINYDDLAPYYDKVESIIGVSGRVVKHAHLDPRQRDHFPYPPCHEHAVAALIDNSCKTLGFTSLPTARAILSQAIGTRASCSYSGFCGGYGCATDAKGSTRAALLGQTTCDIRPHAMVTGIPTDEKGRIRHVNYVDRQGQQHQLRATIYILAANAIESARLLLASTGPRFPNGLANASGLVGKNLLFAGGGVASGMLPFDKVPAHLRHPLHQQGLFINRYIQDFYTLKDENKSEKGGTIQFTFRAASPISRTRQHMRHDGQLVWGSALKKRLDQHFRAGLYIKVETFCDWLPVDSCNVSLDPIVKDRWGLAVARVRIASHPRNIDIGWFLAQKGAAVLRQMGIPKPLALVPGSPPTNLVAGTCRFGNDPRTSVLNANCQAHDVDNLYVTDGSFHPTGGSVPYTMTIMANAFRVGAHIVKRLQQSKHAHES